MSNTSNKVKFGLKNCHYAIATLAADGTVTFGTPVAMPGAVSLSLDAEGDNDPFYADDSVYYMISNNNGYSGDLEVAMFPESMLTDIWGMTKSKNGLIVENANAAASNFALLFEVDGDITGRKYVLYNCSGTRPGITGNTKNDSTEPDTQSSSLTVSPLKDGTIKAHTADDATEAVRKAWYTKVTMPTDTAE